ncbi:MAG: FAD:protein FMN transferase, partial [Bacillota bacterium]
GGDIGLIGSKPDGTPWRIGIRHPRNADRYVGVIPLSGGAVVTSGDYERFFEQDDVRFHHILDPKTGQPARSLISVTITAPTAMEADVLSTAVFVLGPERGMALVESLSGVEAVLVTPEMEILVSTGLKDKFALYEQ